MNRNGLLTRLTRSQTERPALRRRLCRRRSGLEDLEGRVLLAAKIFTVTNTSGLADISGSLLNAVSMANNNSNPAGSVIQFDQSLFSTPQTIVLSRGTLVLSEVNGPLTLNGPGANLLTVSGNNKVGVFQVASSVFATLSGLTIAGGQSNGSDNGGGNANNSIMGNTAVNFIKGIHLDAATADMVLDNTIEQSGAAGIDLTDHSTRNTVESNDADQNFAGIAVDVADSNTITRNTTDDNQNDGIVVVGSNDDSITRNTASGNTPEAIGILVCGNSNTVSLNTADGNALGIAATLSTHTTITRNTANGNSTYGIEVQYDTNPSGQQDTVSLNKAHGNADAGIRLSSDNDTLASRNTTTGG